MACGCHSNEDSTRSNSKCTSCVCSVLRNIKDSTSLCENGTQTYTILFGDLNLNIGGLRLVDFNDRTCCATFVDAEENVLLFDCRKLEGISIQKTMIG